MFQHILQETWLSRTAICLSVRQCQQIQMEEVMKSYPETDNLSFTESVSSMLDALLLKLEVRYAGRSNISSSSALAIPHASREAVSLSGEESALSTTVLQIVRSTLS